MADPLYFEDLVPGRRFNGGTRALDAEQIKAFGREFDPQPFHTDEQAAAATFFKGLAASGWHTTALMMRMVVEGEFRPAGGVIGAGVDELRWPRPVRPGDVLTVTSEVVESRVSKSRPDQGIVRVRHTTVNQNGETVLEIIGNHVVLRRPA